MLGLQFETETSWADIAKDNLQQILTDIDRIFRILPKILDDYEHSLTEKKPDKSNFGKFMFISNLGWFIAGISISVAIMLF